MFCLFSGIETKFAGSSCNDLVTTDGSGTTIISGHFDKRIRFWDTRSDTTSLDILLQGKVTSLDLSRGEFPHHCSVDIRHHKPSIWLSSLAFSYIGCRKPLSGSEEVVMHRLCRGPFQDGWLLFASDVECCHEFVGLLNC
jgi:WD40 repeat protein